jgi:calcium-translocating P-type ATPase
MRGVALAQANAVTRNLLVVYDHRVTDEPTLLAQVETLEVPAEMHVPPSLPPAVVEHIGKERRVRIAVRGLERNLAASRVVLEKLRQRGVRAWAKPLTGHVLVEYNQYKHVLRELVALAARMELPDVPGSDRPEHPLDRLPLWQGLIRAVGSLVGLGVLTIRRLATPTAAGGGHSPAGTAAGILNLVHGIPFVRNQLIHLLGKHRTPLLLDALSIVTLTLANYPLGLIVTGLEALLLLGEVTSRRAAWRRYEDNLDGAAAAEPGSVVRLEAGAIVPHEATVVEGTGTGTDASGHPVSLAPGATVPAGALLAGGPFVLQLEGAEAFDVGGRPAGPRQNLADYYYRWGGVAAAIYVAFTAVRTLSPLRAFEALLLMNPRTAVIGEAIANLAAAARTLRSGVIVVGTRPKRNIQLPDVLILDGARLLIDGLEITEVRTCNPAVLPREVLAVAAIVSTAAGSPWGSAFPKASNAVVTHAAFNGLWATAHVDGDVYNLGPPEDLDAIPDDLVQSLTESGASYLLELRNGDEDTSFGLIALRPRIRTGANVLLEKARQHGVEVRVLARTGGAAVAKVARRVGLAFEGNGNAVDAIRAEQASGALVAYVSESADAAAPFDACDLAIGLGSARTGEFPARADVLAPDLVGVADVLDAGARRGAAVRDGVRLSIAANAIGAGLGLAPTQLGSEQASLVVYLAALAAMGVVTFRLRGGLRLDASLAQLADPRPERWSRRTVEDVVRALNTTSDGLSSVEASNRRQKTAGESTSDQFLTAIRNQLTSPITMVLGGGACLTLVLRQPLNTALLAFTTSLNVLAGVWQEREIGKAAEAIRRLSIGTARVLRDGVPVVCPTPEIVPGDVLILGPGDRVSADARMLAATGLEVNEAALTGESLPVPKSPDDFLDIGRIVLEGSDVVAGSGRAVVVAIGRQTRLGATAAALNVDRSPFSPMGQRLSRILQIALPVSGVGGLMAGVAGLFYGGTPAQQLAVGVTTALSAIPEGLPLLAGVGQAGVANRLASKKALVRRIAAVEALGRVDVACTDKTGTMTEGRLTLRLVADMDQEMFVPAVLPNKLRRVLLTAALASPHPDAREAVTHPTDVAVVRGAMAAGLVNEVKAPRLAEMGFDSARAFHASRVPGRLCVKGAPEKLVPRCSHLRLGDADITIDEEHRADLLRRVVGFAERGLRVLLVAEGPVDAATDDPRGLTALGFVAIADPLRRSVPEAVRRCQAAGIRVIMLTGDHPATAQAIAREAGLLIPGNDVVLRAADLAELTTAELDKRMQGVAVIARAAPLDKLRIIESLRRQGSIVGMTGDGVNDAPSLRLADVGVAMGLGGTEVARQASDVVLTDDDFATLVEALVEGRGFWANMRTALGLLLGGNAGELGVIVGATLMGFGAPLTTVQILLINLITDALPCLAIVLQGPRSRNLEGLAREGLSALDSGLRRDVVRRSLATCLPTLGAYLFTQLQAGPQQASAVAFTGVVATQLAQTLDAGRVRGGLSGSVIGAVGASAALLASAVALPPIRNFLGLAMPTLAGWGTVGVAAAGAVAMSRLISTVSEPGGDGSILPVFKKWLDLLTPPIPNLGVAPAR